MNNTMLTAYLKYSVQGMDLVADIKKGVNKSLPLILFVVALSFAGFAVATDAGLATDEALTQVGTMFSSAMKMGLALISAVVFVIVAWAVVTKFNDARRGRADWGEVVLPFIVGAGCLIFIGWLVDNGNTAAEEIGGTTEG